MNLDDIRARHIPYNAVMQEGPVCNWCEMTYPCDAAQLVALLTVERIALALMDNDPTADPDERDEWWTTPNNMAAALLAALTKETT